MLAHVYELVALFIGLIGMAKDICDLVFSIRFAFFEVYGTFLPIQTF